MKTILFLAALLGAIGIAFGALGAHKLETILTAKQLAVWNTAVKYQMIHVIMIIVLLISANGKQFFTPSIFFLVGIFLFSGSLYLLSAKNILKIEDYAKILGPITPIGGLSFIIGWVLLALRFLLKF